MACNIATSAAISSAAVSADTFFTSFSTPTNSNPPFSSPFSQSNFFSNNNNYKSRTFIISKNHPESQNRTICRAADYQFPDPIPEFAVSETEKFKAHLMQNLSKEDIYGDELDEVVGICTEFAGGVLIDVSLAHGLSNSEGIVNIKEMMNLMEYYMVAISTSWLTGFWEELLKLRGLVLLDSIRLV